jgi:hypothetical protein
MSSQAFADRSRALHRARGGHAPVGPLLGLATVVGFLVAFAIAPPDEPAADATAAQAVAYWSSHDDRQMLAVVVLAISVATLVGFGALLRDALRAADGGREPFARIAFTGIVIAGTGILVNLGITFAAADTAGDVSPQVTQALSALSVDFATPMVVGFGLMMIASGVVVVRTGLVPRSLGWLSILVGLLGLTPAGIVEFWGLPVWIVILSGGLYRRRDGATAAF